MHKSQPGRHTHLLGHCLSPAHQTIAHVSNLMTTQQMRIMPHGQDKDTNTPSKCGLLHASPPSMCGGRMRQLLGTCCGWQTCRPRCRRSGCRAPRSWCACGSGRSASGSPGPAVQTPPVARHTSGSRCVDHRIELQDRPPAGAAATARCNAAPWGLQGRGREHRVEQRQAGRSHEQST